MKASLLAVSLLALVGCSKECIDSRSFSSWALQQTWFISEVPDIENLGAAFGDSGGTFYEPLRVPEFEYCAQGNRLHIEYGDVFTRRMVVDILALDDEKMLLQFPDGEQFEYFRAGR